MSTCERCRERACHDENSITLVRRAADADVSRARAGTLVGAHGPRPRPRRITVAVTLHRRVSRVLVLPRVLPRVPSPKARRAGPVHRPRRRLYVFARVVWRAVVCIMFRTGFTNYTFPGHSDTGGDSNEAPATQERPTEPGNASGRPGARAQTPDRDSVPQTTSHTKPAHTLR